MRKIYTKTLLTALTVVGLSACGGGSSKSSTPVYSGLSDLEYKTLNLQAKFTDGDVNSTYVFKDKYQTTSNGDSALIDVRSNSNVVGYCMELEGDVFSYLCVTKLKDGRSFAHALKIEDNGKIKGNFKYSKTGNSNELAEVVLADKADAPVSGTVSTTAEGTNKSSINKIDVHKFYGKGLARKLTTKTNTKVVTKINEMLNTLKK